jgi:glycosyltransferase involved in cell wall biosynthesis
VNVLDSAEYASVSHVYDQIIGIANLPVANSEYVAQTVKDRYATEIPVIYSGVDVNYFRKLASERSHQKGALRVMFAGSFQERKHPELVLEAAHRWPNVEFILMGDGPLRPLLANRISTEKLSNVSLISTKEYTEYAKLLVTADVFLFPSRVEGLGKVLLESAASGIPSLVFNDYRAAAVLDGVTGYQVTTFGEMLERLDRLIENEELRLRMGAAAVQHVKQFDWDLITKQWERVFEEVVLSR